MKPFALIIIGNSEQARRYKKAIDGVGFQVQAVTTGARAQAQLTFITPDLIVLDLHLPDIPGEVVLRQIKACRRLADTHLILLSAGESLTEDDTPGLSTIVKRSVRPAELASLAKSMKKKTIRV